MSDDIWYSSRDHATNSSREIPVSDLSRGHAMRELEASTDARDPAGRVDSYSFGLQEWADMMQSAYPLPLEEC